MTKRKEWSICQDSLEPLADKLRLLASRFGDVYDFDALDQLDNEYQTIRKASPHSDHLLTDAQRARLAELSKLMSAWKEPPCPRDVEMLYEEHHIDRAGECLKAIVSVDFAADFTLKLLSARKRFFSLDFKASQILNGDIDKTSTTGIHYAIRRLINQYYEQLHAAFPGCEEQPTGDELPDHLRKMEVEILDEYSGVACEFRDVSKYLKAVAAIVRGKTQLREAATPPKAREGGGVSSIAKIYAPPLSRHFAKLEAAVERMRRDKVPADEFLQQLHEITQIPTDATAKELGEAVGVTAQSITATQWWADNRKGKRKAHAQEKIAFRQNLYREELDINSGKKAKRQADADKEKEVDER